MRETVLVLDEPADAAVDAAAQLLAARGLSITHRTRYSVAFADPDVPAGGPAGASPAATEGELLPGTGQVAAVPVQVRPEWCRVWVTVNGAGAAATAAAAYVAEQGARSARVTAAVRELEAGIYDEARWPAYEAALRKTLLASGASPQQVGQKVAAFKKRWAALGRKAAAAPAEEPPASL